MNRLQLLLAFLLAASQAFAQQLPLFTQYRENFDIINPASVGADYLAFEQNVSFGGTYRTQWTEYTGNPTTQTIRGSFLYAEPNGFNIIAGGHIMNDQTGPSGFTGLYGRIGGVITGDPYDGGVSFGMNLGIVQYRLKGSEIRLRESNDILEGTNLSQWFPDVGVGVFAYKKVGGYGFGEGSYIYAGASVPQVLGLDLNFQSGQAEVVTQRIQHAYANVGWMKFLPDDSFLEITSWGKYVPNAPFNMDINLRYMMPQGFIWVGAGSSISGNFHTETGFILGRDNPDNRFFKVGYSFDYSFSDFGPEAGGTHEINLSYSFEY
ncbi:MAG: PorP/SprF family type IX secretion system membrane protein [Phaeodactylibacter sp.]|nr:PorP/SprF family type IX secretion system membrane protein [Phaeodactylibacter sp.]